MKPIRIGINGFGRIGRVAARIALKREGLTLAAINSRADSASDAHLLKYDSSYGIFPASITSTTDSISIDGETVLVFAESDPKNIPWKKASVDIVLEATGVFRGHSEASVHRNAGAKKVIITAPAKDSMPTFCLGVNHASYNPHNDHVVSNASCTTNCLATTAKVIDDAFGIVRGFMTTIHSYTDSQNLLDNSHKKDLRLARAAALNIIPAATGASKTLGLVLPHLTGKIYSQAIRVPTATVSLIDLVVEIKKTVSADKINNAFKNYADKNLNGILGISFGPIVSSDVRGSSLSSLIDGQLTQVNGNLVNVKAWYDNEWGYATRLIDLAQYIGKQL